MTKGSKDELIKTEILKVAQKLFQQYGLNKTTMEDIAQAAGKGKSTLYYYYKSKEEIFDAVLFLEMDDVFRLTLKAVEIAQTAEEKIRAFAITKFKVVQEKTNLYNIVSGELKEDIQVLTKIRRRYNQRELKILTNIIEFGIKTGEFINLSPEDLERNAFAIICSFRGVKMCLYFENRCNEVELYLKHVITMLLQSIRKKSIIIEEDKKIISDIYQIN
jgi:AcrR family transcriptional regulator